MNSVIPFIVLLCLHSSYSNVHSNRPNVHSSRSKVVLNARGIIPTVFTPMNPDQTVNFDVIPRYAQFLHSHGIKYIIVGDLDGELMNLSLQDAKDVFSTWDDCCYDLGMGIIAQVGGAPFVEVIETAKYAASLKSVVALLTLSDQVYPPNSIEELVDFLTLISDAVPDLPLLYDHVSEISGLEELMPEFVVAASGNMSNFGGMRFRGGNLIQAYRVLMEMEHGTHLYYSGSYVLAGATALGIKSTTATIYNIFPELVQEVVSSSTAGDFETAMDKNLELARAQRVITSEGPWVPTMKATMGLVTGIPMGPPVLPLRPISNHTVERIRLGLIDIGRLKCYDDY